MLRGEVAPFGIKVSIIEPGPIRSEFLGTVGRTLVSETDAAAGPYATLKQSFLKTSGSWLNARVEGTPEDVAKAIERAVTARRPKPRYVVTPAARGLILAHSLLPERAWDSLTRRVIGA